ncbi:N-acetylglutaminylglutamine synthetase [Halioxenophilus sp. WMMB6]|uniref:N-acetylglutaminylglutamine synthetase n=1 Tax=Halioxenophilus sp. WMMB6 TaxID=3073815 RepID=UPI00295F5B3F|nr:N-acetylglutaminylglutamine synthetase [Halioxenophilus sp. WMMB6]
MTKQSPTTDERGHKHHDPMDPSVMASLKHWGDPLTDPTDEPMAKEVALDCGWGRLLFGQTFQNPQTVAEILRREKRDQRDIALYVRDPNLILACAPQELFLDPSLTYRLDFRHYQPRPDQPQAVRIRAINEHDNQRDIDRLYKVHNMVPAYDGFYSKLKEIPAITMLVAEDVSTGDIIGAVTGVDHRLAINDPDNGCSLWALVADPQAQIPAVGEWLTRALVEKLQADGRDFMDLSVMHNNTKAIRLYERLGFKQVPVYCIKKKNSINERWFVGEDPEEGLNIYAKIITMEARRRGIGVEILDAEGGFFKLTLGGRSITCRESLSELTSAIAMSRCDDKAVTRRVLEHEGLRVPEQITSEDADTVATFLNRHHRVVVKPARGEQGRGIKVGLTKLDEVHEAICEAANYSDKVLLEECVDGDDLRIIVIDYQVVAAAVRRPPYVIGNGRETVAELVSALSQRRAAATHGESTIPVDSETARCVRQAGFELDDVLPSGERVKVRSTANLHTGGTIHDVTPQLHPVLITAARRAARALHIPVVGLDFLVPSVSGPDYVIIEANERPGLANHEPQPTVERFVDLLFPHTKSVHSDSEE